MKSVASGGDESAPGFAGFSSMTAGKPAATPGLTLVSSSDTGQSAWDGITADDTPAVRITLNGNGANAPVAGDVVKLYSSGTLVGSATLSGSDVASGYVELTASSLGADGTKSLTATVTNAWGESESSRALALTLDRTAPSIAGAVATGNTVVLTYADAFDLDGWTGTPVSAFAVKIDGAAVAVNSAVVNAPARTVTLYIGAMLRYGQAVTVSYIDPSAGNDAVATQDVAGNDAVSAIDLAVVNTTPAGTVAAPGLTLTAASDTGQSVWDRITADDTPTVRVTLNGSGASAAVAGDVVKVYSGATLVGTATLTSGNIGSGYVEITTSSLGADGAKHLSATVTNAAGNVSAPSSALALTLDRTAPAITSAVASGNTVVLAYTDALDLDGWTGTPASAFTVTVNGAAVSISSAVVNASAKTVTLYIGTMIQAGHNVTVSYTDPSAADDGHATQDVAGNDAAGFVGMVAANAIPDVTPPAAPGLALTDVSDTGSSAADRITRDDTPTLRVTLNGTGAAKPAAGDTVRVYSDGTLVGTVSLTAADVSAGYVDVTTASLGSDGAKRLTARITDVAGNASGASSTLTITLDRTATGSPSLSLRSSSDSGASSSDAITSDDTPRVRVELDELFDDGARPVVGDVLKIYSNGALIAAATLTSDMIDDERVELTLPALGADGAKSLTATVTDKAGNESAPSAPLAMTLDTTGPVLSAATVDGVTLTLVYSDLVALDAAKPASRSAYTVKVDGSAVGIVSLAVNGAARTVTLTLATPVVAGQGVTVSYVDSSGDNSKAIQDLAGNDASSVSDYTAVNVTAGIDRSPEAAADTATVTEDESTPVAGNVMDNDALGDGAGAQHTVTWGSEAARYGTLTRNADGSYIYLLDNALAAVQQLAPGQTLSEAFSYSLSDADGDGSAATLTITIVGTNDTPVAVADLNTIAEDDADPATGNVLGNDSDADASDGLGVIAVAGEEGNVGGTIAAAYGTVRIEADGTYAYTLNSTLAAVQALTPGQTLLDAIAYTVADEHGATSTSTLTIRITGTDDQPLAVADEATVMEDPGAALFGNVTANDVIGDGAAAENVVIWGDETAQYGSLTKNPDGAYSYTLNDALPAVQQLAAGQMLTETFSYVLRDADGDTASARLTITIAGTNDAPVAVADINTVTEDAAAPVAGNVLTNDTDVDAGATKSVIAMDGEAENVGAAIATTYGRITLNADGTYVYALNNDLPAVQALDFGQTLTDSITYTVGDGEGGSATSTLTITIAGAYDAPVVNVYEDGAARTPARSESADGALPGGAGWSVTTGPQHGTAVLDAEGTWTYTLANGDARVQSLNEGETLVDSFVVSRPGTLTDTIQIGDGNAPLTSGRDQTAVLTLRDDFMAALAGGTSGARVTLFTDFQRAPFTTPVPAGERDVGLEEQVQVRITVGGKTFIVVQPRDGEDDDHDDDDHDDDDRDDDDDDDRRGRHRGQGDHDDDDDGDDDGRRWSFDAASGLMTASVSFGEIREARYDSGSKSWVLVRGGATLDRHLESGEVPPQWTLVYDDNEGGPEQARVMKFAFSLPGEQAAQETIHITIHGTNDAPVAVADVNVVAEDATAPVSGNLLINDTDADAGASRTVSAVFGHAGDVGRGVATAYGTVTVNADGSYGYTLNNALGAVSGLNPGETLTDVITYTMIDDHGASSTSTLTITITGADDLPVAVADTATMEEDAGTPITGNVLANDTLGDGTVAQNSITWGTEAARYGTIIKSADGTYSYSVNNALAAVQQLAPGQTLTETFSYTLTDADGDASTAHLTIRIHGTNDVPVITSPASVTVAEDHATTAPVYTVTATDIDADALTYSLSGPDASAFTVDRATGVVKFLAAPNFESKSEYSIEVIASDGTAQVVQAVTVRIADVAPVGADRTITTAEDTAYVFSAADFEFAQRDPNADPQSFAVRIDALPDHGALTLDGDALVAGSVVSAADIAAGKLTFEPGADANGADYARFGVSLRDSEGTFTAANTVTIDVTAVNDAPVGSGTVVLPADPEDTTAPTERTVAELFAARFDDTADSVSEGSAANELAGIAIVHHAHEGAKGTWQYSSDGAEWADLDTVTGPASAITLRSTDSLRFVPAADYNGEAPAITVKLVDSSAAVATAAVVDVSSAGGMSPYSDGDIMLRHTVVPVAGMPIVTANDVSGPQDGAIALPIDVSGGDPGESLTVTVSGIPNGMRFITGTGETYAPTDGTLTLTTTQLAGLRITPPDGFSGTVALGVSATATDNAGRKTSAEQRVFIAVAPAPSPEPPPPPAPPPPIEPPPMEPPPVEPPPVNPPPVNPPPVQPPPVEPPPVVPPPILPAPAAPPAAEPLPLPSLPAPPVAAPPVGEPLRANSFAPGATQQIIVPVVVAVPPVSPAGMPPSALPSDGSQNTSTLPTGRINLLQGVPATAGAVSAMPGSAPQLEATDRGFPVMRAPAPTPAGPGGVGAPGGSNNPADAPSSPSIADGAQQRGVDRLFVFQGIPNASATVGRMIEFTVPREAFGHTNMRAIVQLDAMRTNGQPLPGWLDFDPVSGKFSGRPPRDAEATIEIKVVARDNEGREIATTFTIRVSDTAAPAQNSAHGDSDAEPTVVADAGDLDDPDGKDKQRKDGRDDAPRREKARIAAKPFSEQLHRARQDALLNRIMESEEPPAKAPPSVPARKA